MQNYDENFLLQLDSCPFRETYARLTLLTWDEKPIQYIEGQVTGGSINVDGNSNLRRTCSLTLVASSGFKLNENWVLRHKFILEIGLKNFVNSSYDDIIWFKQGLFIITQFSNSLATNNYTINISGKDKMCLLNGDISGKLPHETDFGVEEAIHDDGSKDFYDIPIETIIRESVIKFAQEPTQNIIINDLADSGLYLMEYRGKDNGYIIIDKNTKIIDFTFDGETACYINKQKTSLAKIPNYLKLNDILNQIEDKTATVITFTNKSSSKEYYVVKLSFGDLAGYKLTELTYAGDLISNIGDSLTSMLDKVKNMLGNFEYFYDIDGKFVFQRKKDYLYTMPNKLVNGNSLIDVYVNPELNDIAYNFSNILLTQLSNNPDITKIKNDFSIWGQRKSISGVEIPVHVRYAIDRKPTSYTNYEGETYEADEYDWRELIYQMAIDYINKRKNDDFINKIKVNGKKIINGKTGYEQYYTDIQGFWRQLYDGENKEWLIKDNTMELNFWFDFLELTEESPLYQYSVFQIGDRIDVIDSKDLKAIYYGEVPSIIYQTPQEQKENKFAINTAYTYIMLPEQINDLFIVSSKGNSIFDKLSNVLYQDTYFHSQISFSALPIYYLQPNTLILLDNKEVGISGKYLISRISYQLNYSSTMSVQASYIQNFLK